MASAKPGGKAGAKVPASIAKLSVEELQSMCVDTLKKLRARDKRIEVRTCGLAYPASWTKARRCSKELVLNSATQPARKSTAIAPVCIGEDHMLNGFSLND